MSDQQIDRVKVWDDQEIVLTHLPVLERKRKREKKGAKTNSGTLKNDF